jgi:hypothetical protein
MSGEGKRSGDLSGECPFTPYTYALNQTLDTMLLLVAVPKFPLNLLTKTVAYKFVNTKRTVHGFVSQQQTEGRS